ncbi:MAG: DNA internalization-related competence protein ComEC/Rec2 [Bacilli bacterium]|nr:DNA internalization-related competence protein ComEC/Rec2 [Bacilli bacterium]
MKKLKTILQSKFLYVSLFLFLFIYIIVFTKLIDYQSKYGDGDIILSGRVVKYSLSNDKLSFVIKAKEKILSTYYNDDNLNNINLKIGDFVTVSGKLSMPAVNTIPNTFNYKEYLYSNKIYKTLSVSEIKIKNNESNIFEKIKNYFYKRCEGNEYLKLFIVGDKSSLDENIYESFKDTGVAHLLAVSGMHVSVLVSILSYLLKWVKNTKKQIIISTFLLFYAYIVNFSASILRVVVFYIINNINKIFELKLSNKQVLFWAAIIMLIINPFLIYQAGFLYSFVTVYSIIVTQKYLCGKYAKDTLIISFWALLFTLPITVSMNYEINLITFISNLLLIPYVTFILYPLSLLCFVFSFLMPIFSLLTGLMEIIIIFINKIDIFVIGIPKMNVVIILSYYLMLLFAIYFNSKVYFATIIMLVLIVKMAPRFDSVLQITYLDVGQGDCCLISLPYNKENIMIDTGGQISYGNTKNYNISDNVILYLKSIGINKLNCLILTHGDYDHMGEAINLVNNFKVEKVIFNCGPHNDLERELIKVLHKKKIPYYSCIKELNIDDNKLYFLNNKDYGNENDNSSVIYTELNDYKFLFMGDAGVEVEEDLVEEYNLQNIDVLKVGHHGSKTSSSEEFINEMNPKYSIISVGKNNRYGHPNKEVLDTLKDSKIYRTDQDGSIMFKIKNNKLKIETCTP